MPHEPLPSDPRSGTPGDVSSGDVSSGDVEALLAGLPLPAARAEFRGELRRQFLGGEGRDLVSSPSLLAPRAQREVVAAQAPAGRRRTASPRLVWAGLTVAAAAVLALTLVPRGGPDDPAPALVWSLRGAQAESSGLLAAANAGAEWTHPGDEPVDLIVAGSFIVRVLPRTRFTPPSHEQLAANAPLRFLLGEGELLVRTCSTYAGPPIEVQSPEALVHITGTAVSVMRAAEGTCVCVYAGTVVARHLATGRQEPVGPEVRWFAFAEPHPSLGECHREALRSESLLLGEHASEHERALKALGAEPLFD